MYVPLVSFVFKRTLSFIVKVSIEVYKIYSSSHNSQVIKGYLIGEPSVICAYNKKINHTLKINNNNRVEFFFLLSFI